MRKLTLIVAAAAMAAQVGATGELNPAYGTKAGAKNGEQPANTVGGDEFKKLYDNCDALLNGTQRNNMSTNDGVYYIYPNDPDKAWAYIVIKFIRDSNPDEAYTCNWEAYTANNAQAGMTLWVWDPRPIGEGGQRFVNLDSSPTGVPTEPRSFNFDGSAYFTWQDNDGAYVCWFLLQGLTSAGHRWLKVDVVDLHY